MSLPGESNVNKTCWPVHDGIKDGKNVSNAKSDATLASGLLALIFHLTECQGQHR